MPGCHLDEANALAARLRSALEANEFLLSDGTALTVTASFGVAKGDLGQLAWRRLVKAADAALYRAKSDGRNCVRHSAPLYAPLVPDLGDLDMEMPVQKTSILNDRR